MKYPANDCKVGTMDTEQWLEIFRYHKCLIV